jgi:hypothetical protein
LAADAAPTPAKPRKPRVRKAPALKPPESEPDGALVNTPPSPTEQRIQWLMMVVLAVVVVGGGWAWFSFIDKVPRMVTQWVQPSSSGAASRPVSLQPRP